MTGQAVKVNRAKLEACLTCPLCNKLFNNATTISECLHTFCRGCIDKKLIDEQLKHCPVCNANLGCSPLDKLRTDHSLQDLRDRILPQERKIAKTPKNSVASVKRQKKKSLSSLKANARGAKATPEREVFAPSQPDCSSPKPEKVEEDVRKDEKQPRRIGILDEVSTKLTARRAKVVARKKYLLKELPPPCEPDKVIGDQRKEDDDCFLLKISNESSKARVQDSSKADSSQQIVANKILMDNVESCQEKLDLFEPLNSFVEAARKNKSCSKSTMQEHAVTPSVESSDNDCQPMVEVKRHCHQTNENDDQNNEPNPSRSSDTNGRKLKFSEDLNVPVVQPVITSNGESNRVFGPVWFSLVASEVSDEGAQLPKISPSFLRVKDGTLLVSHIKMYIVKKLGLVSESEVEILLQGKPVLACMQLQQLVELWLQTKPLNEKFQTHVGSSAKDFVMVLSYHRKT